jgi:phosphoribosyl-ATP pyrophosphohydrolase
MTDSIHRLYDAVLAIRASDPVTSRTAKLMREGSVKMAKKLAEEAVEAGHEAILKDKPALVRESADLIYNLCCVWADAGVTPQDVWAEMDRREKMLGIAEKLPKPARAARQNGAAGGQAAATGKAPGAPR